MTAIHLNELGIVCALGAGKRAVAEALFADDMPRGVAMTDRWTPGRALALGAFDRELPALDALPLALRSRNNALLKLALDEMRPQVDRAIATHGDARVAIVLGTSTSGIAEGERAQRHFQVHGRRPEDFHYAQQEIASPAAFLAHELGTRGPAHVISTACSSSAKAIASGARLLRAGLADAVIAGGADSLCAFTIAGFQSLEAVSVARCNPFSANRCGINIGEGAALFLMTREPGAVRLEGAGESADAHHMSAPDPTGAGALRAIAQAIERAGIAARDIDYINLHGTATAQNDAMESAVVAELFATGTPCSGDTAWPERIALSAPWAARRASAPWTSTKACSSSERSPHASVTPARSHAAVLRVRTIESPSVRTSNPNVSSAASVVSKDARRDSVSQCSPAGEESTARRPSRPSSRR